MKLVTISLQIPVWVDEIFRKEAKARITSKSSAIRDVLIEHVDKIKAECQPTPSAKTPATSR